MANARILVVGSINMDVVARVDRLPRPGETVLGGSIAYIPGGKGANQAVAAARLGACVRLIGCIGGDPFGDELQSSLESNGVDLQFVRKSSSTTSGVAMIWVEAGGQNEIVVASGSNGELAVDDIERDAAWSDASVVLLQLETPAAAIEAAVEFARRRKVLCILDPAPAPMVGLSDQLSSVDVLTPNQSEAHSLTGVTIDSVADAQKAAKILRQRGARSVVIKLGELGAYWLGPDERGVHVKAPTVKVVDTTAAGDAFNGALGVSLAEGRSFEDALLFACSAGSLACTRPGAQQAMPTRGEVEEFTARAGAKQ